MVQRSASQRVSPLQILRQCLQADLAKLHDRIFDLQICDTEHDLQDAEDLILEITRKVNFLNSINLSDPEFA